MRWYTDQEKQQDADTAQQESSAINTLTWQKQGEQKIMTTKDSTNRNFYKESGSNKNYGNKPKENMEMIRNGKKQ